MILNDEIYNINHVKIKDASKQRLLEDIKKQLHALDRPLQQAEEILEVILNQYEKIKGRFEGNNRLKRGDTITLDDDEIKITLEFDDFESLWADDYLKDNKNDQ